MRGVAILLIAQTILHVSINCFYHKNPNAGKWLWIRMVITFSNKIYFEVTFELLNLKVKIDYVNLANISRFKYNKLMVICLKNLKRAKIYTWSLK